MEDYTRKKSLFSGTKYHGSRNVILKDKYEVDMKIIENNESLLTPWELEFMTSIYDRRFLTEKQYDVFERIYKNVLNKRKE